MDLARALQLVSEVRYKPTYKITAEPSGDDHIYIRADYTAPDSSKQYAPDYRVTTQVHSLGVIKISGIASDLDLLRQVLNFLIETEIHEAREFFRHTPTWNSPFHPHSRDGEISWQITKHDDRGGLPGFELDLSDFVRPVIE